MGAATKGGALRNFGAIFQNKGRQTPVTRLIVGFLSTALWMLFSSALIILNKNLYRMGFQYPFFVTGMGQLFSALGGMALVSAGFLPLRPIPERRFLIFNLLPIVASSTATMFFGNNSYLYLSVAFIQILKAFTPALTLLLCVLAGVERPHLPLLASVLLIASGTAGAVLIESGTPSFQVKGLVSFLLSSITEAARVVGAEVLLGAQKFNTAEALVYIGGPTAAALLLGALLVEVPQINAAAAAAVAGAGTSPSSAAAAAAAAAGSEAAAGTAAVAAAGWALMWQAPWAFFSAFFMSFLVNLSCFFAIQTTSSLTFKVAGCVKNVAVVWYGVVAHGDHISVLQVLGYFVSVVGFAVYSRLKMIQGAVSRASKRKKE